MRRALFLAAALALSLPSLGGGGAEAFVLYTTSRGIALHWGPGPIEFYIADDLPAELERSRVEAAADASWDAWTTLDCAPRAGGLAGFAPSLSPEMTDGINAIIWVHDETQWRQSYSETELARTTVTHRSQSGEIVDADMVINAGGFRYSDSLECAPNAYDLRSLLTHEFGHFFGLDHSGRLVATMDPNTDPGVCDKRDLDADDIAGFCAIYEPLQPPVSEPAPEPDPLADAGPTEPDGGDIDELEAGQDLDDCSGGGAHGALAWILLAWLSLYGLGAKRRGHRSRGPSRPR